MSRETRVNGHMTDGLTDSRKHSASRCLAHLAASVGIIAISMQD